MEVDRSLKAGMVPCPLLTLKRQQNQVRGPGRLPFPHKSIDHTTQKILRSLIHSCLTFCSIFSTQLGAGLAVKWGQTTWNGTQASFHHLQTRPASTVWPAQGCFQNSPLFTASQKFKWGKTFLLKQKVHLPFSHLPFHLSLQLPLLSLSDGVNCSFFVKRHPSTIECGISSCTQDFRKPINIMYQPNAKGTALPQRWHDLSSSSQALMNRATESFPEVGVLGLWAGLSRAERICIEQASLEATQGREAWRGCRFPR